MPTLQETLTRKAGPLPVWAYGALLAGGVGIFWYLRHRASSGSSSPTVGSAVQYGGGVPDPLAGGGSTSEPPTSGGGDSGQNPADIASILTGITQWFNTILTAINQLKPPATQNPPPSPSQPPAGNPGNNNPPPTNGGGGGTPPATTPTDFGTGLPGMNLNSYLVDIPTGQGIPQLDLRPGLLNIIGLHESIPVSHLQGWTAWHMDNGVWSQYGPTDSVTGVAVLAPYGQTPNSLSAWKLLQTAGVPANQHPGPVPVTQ